MPEPGAGLLACSCSAVTGLHVGFVLVGGVQYVSTVGIECGSGELLRDPLAARINLTGTLPSRVVSGASWGGARLRGPRLSLVLCATAELC